MGGSWGHLPHKLLALELTIALLGETQTKIICLFFEL